jgi:hypothetical protein
MYLLDTNIISALRRPGKMPQNLHAWACDAVRHRAAI